MYHMFLYNVVSGEKSEGGAGVRMGEGKEGVSSGGGGLKRPGQFGGDGRAPDAKRKRT